MTSRLIIIIMFVSSCRSVDTNPYDTIRSSKEYLNSSRIERLFVNERYHVSYDSTYNGVQYSFISLHIDGKAFVSPAFTSKGSMIRFMGRHDLDSYTGFQNGSGVYYLSNDTLNIVTYSPISSGSVPAVYGYTRYIGVLKDDSTLAMKRVIVDLPGWSADVNAEYKRWGLDLPDIY